MANLITWVALCLLFSTVSVVPSPVRTDDRWPSGLSSKRLKRGHSHSKREIMKRLAQAVQPTNLDKSAVHIADKNCEGDKCPTKRPEKNFINDYYDVAPNANSKAEKIDSDYQASVIDGGFGAQSRKTKVFEADYFHLGARSLPRQQPAEACLDCRVLNIVISDITGGRRKVLSDTKYTL